MQSKLHHMSSRLAPLQSSFVCPAAANGQSAERGLRRRSHSYSGYIPYELRARIDSGALLARRGLQDGLDKLSKLDSPGIEVSQDTSAVWPDTDEELPFPETSSTSDGKMETWADSCPLSDESPCCADVVAAPRNAHHVQALPLKGPLLASIDDEDCAHIMHSSSLLLMRPPKNDDVEDFGFPYGFSATDALWAYKKSCVVIDCGVERHPPSFDGLPVKQSVVLEELIEFEVDRHPPSCDGLPVKQPVLPVQAYDKRPEAAKVEPNGNCSNSQTPSVASSLMQQFLDQLKREVSQEELQSQNHSEDVRHDDREDSPDNLKTTVMLRNLPPSINQAGLVEELDVRGFAGQYDFCYMPSSFGAGVNKGFAFVNFIVANVARTFIESWHGQRYLGIDPKEPALNISYGVRQGLEENLLKWNLSRMRRVRNPKHRPFIAKSCEPDS